MKRLNELKESKRESHRLSMMMSDDAIERVKKRSYAEFCMFEKQVKAEVKKIRKRREKSKWSFKEKASEREERKENADKEESEEEEIDEEQEMSKAVQEGMLLVWNEPPD